MCRISVLCLMVFMTCSSANAAPPLIREAIIPDYDYSQTRSIVLYGEDDYVYLSNPFEHAAPSMGALVYEILLLYVPNLQTLSMPSDQPTHVLDLMMKDSIGRWRLGQRLYVGNSWLSDGKSVALMMPADHQLLTELLTRRYEHGTRYEIDPTKMLKRIKKSLRPDDWLAQDISAREAILRMPASDYQRGGYDPGVKIRRKWGNNPDIVDEQALPDSSTPTSNSETKIAPEVELENITSVTTHAAPVNYVQEGEINSSLPSPELKVNNDKSFLTGLMFLGLLLLSLMLRRKWSS